MQQRFDSPVVQNEPVLISAFESDDAIFTARFVDLSSEGMTIKLNADLKVGSLLRLEYRDSLMMTEVCRCSPDQGEFSAGLVILSCLEKSELKRLRREAVTGTAGRP
jgi:hypothetical protein